MRILKLYFVTAVFGLVLSCTTTKKIDQDDDFATEPTDATLSAEPSASAANGTTDEFNLDAPAAAEAPAAGQAASPAAPADEFADFNDPAAQAAAPPPAAVTTDPAPTDTPSSAPVAQAAPAPVDEFAQFDQPAAATPPSGEGVIPPAETPATAETVATPAAEVVPVPADVPPVPETVAEMPPPAAVEAPAPVMAQIQQITYRPNQSGGAVTIQGDQPLQFTTRLNSATNQLVVEVQNAVVPNRLKRPLNTKDMASTIGSVDIYQKPDSKIARFVVQLRPGSAEPLVQPEGNSVLIIGAANEAFVAKQKADAQRSAKAKAAVQSSDEFVDLASDGIMSSQSLEDFLVGNHKYYGKKISIETNDLDVKEAIKFIAEESGANLLMDDGLDGKISLKLRQVPWDQALILILKAKKLGYVRQGNVLRIAKLSELQNEEVEAFKLLQNRRSNEPLIVKRFFISYANLAELQAKIREFIQSTAPASTATTIAGQAVGATGAAAGNGAAGNGAAGNRGAVGSGGGAVNNAAFGGQQGAFAGQNNAGSFGANGGANGGANNGQSQANGQNGTSANDANLARQVQLGRVIADERTGTLIVTDTPDNMAKIEKLIAALDTQPKQIVVESRIINATESFSRSMGFNWSSGGNTASANSAALGITTHDPKAPSNVLSSTFSWKNLDIIGNLDAIISLGEIQQKVKILNTQRVTVTSGKAAAIGTQSTLRLPKTTIATTTSGSTANLGTTEYEAIPFGLKGTVLAQASNENTVSAEIEIQQTAITDPATASTATNNIGGRVVAQSGQTLAVNASFSSTNSNSENGVPGLRDIPVLGNLFKGKTDSLQKAETLVFITLTILDPVTGVFKKASGDIETTAPVVQ